MNSATKTYKNKNFTKRDYECINVVFAVGETAPRGAQWVETSEEIPASMCMIERVAGVAYYGWL